MESTIECISCKKVFDISMVEIFSADCDISFNMASCNLFLRISASRDLDFAERHTAAMLSVSKGPFLDDLHLKHT